MIQIITKDASTHIIFGRRTIILHSMEYSSFKEDLFVLRAGKSTKINPEDLSLIDFHLLFHKHIPQYQDSTIPHLDIKPLLNKYTWASKMTYGTL